jgi:hypothetical protein
MYNIFFNVFGIILLIMNVAGLINYCLAYKKCDTDAGRVGCIVAVLVQFLMVLFIVMSLLR